MFSFCRFFSQNQDFLLDIFVYPCGSDVCFPKAHTRGCQVLAECGQRGTATAAASLRATGWWAWNVSPVYFKGELRCLLLDETCDESLCYMGRLIWLRQKTPSLIRHWQSVFHITPRHSLTPSLCTMSTPLRHNNIPAHWMAYSIFGKEALFKTRTDGETPNGSSFYLKVSCRSSVLQNRNCAGDCVDTG